MAFTVEDIEHLAGLARLELTEEEKRKYHAQIADILDYFEVMQELDVSDITPTESILPHDTVLRQDEVEPGIEPEALLVNVDENDKEGDQFRVDAILEDAT
jgi:aspartyl-tRNA(Asn)/glutamyl-tRNA(Gln) amidotransferase subunit C